MTPSDRARPPRLARWLLRRTLDGAARSAIVGDLDEEFDRFMLPRLGARAAQRWYWRQTVASIVACLRNRAESVVDPDEPSFSNVRTLMQDRHGLSTDLRAALRFCFRSPVTSAAVILTLAIGVAANTAVFSVVNATLFKKLPVANADRLVAVGSKRGGAFTYAEYLASRDAAGLRAIVAGGRTSTTMGEGDARRRVVVDFVTANTFEALGTAPALHGRLLAATDDVPGAPVLVVSEAFWRRGLGADPGIVGRTVNLDRAFFTIVGVAAKGFSGAQIGFSPDVWVPLTHGPAMQENPGMLDERSAWLGLMGVLDEPRSIAIARDGLTTRWQAIGRLDEAILTPIPRGRSWYSPQPDARLRLVALFVLLILVIGCLNVSTLLGAGVHQRSRELAIRASLGAGRIRLLRQLLAEHLMLAAVGGVVGGVVGVWMARGLATLMHSRFTPGDVDVTPDGYVVLFTIAVSLVTGLAVGVTPAVRWSKVRALSALQGGGTGITRMTRSASLWWLIPGQVALGTVLLASAGVLVQTVHNLKGGIETTAPERVWFADLQGDGAPVTAAGFDDYQARLRAHLRTLGGVESASVATGRPLASLRRGPLRVEGMTVVPDSRPMPWGPPPPPPPRGHAPLGKMWIVSSTYCTPDFFASLALPIVRGRDFTNADGAGAPRVAIVNETLAARAFGKADPVGKRVGWAGGDAFDIEIVGVVRDLRSEDLRAAAPDAIFFPLPQIPRGETVDPTATGAARRIDLTIVLRAADERTLNREQVLRHVTAFDPRAFVDRIATFDEEAGRTLSQERLLAWVGSTLGAIALALLIVGLYGTLTAAVVRSRRELGIRLALGATPRAVRSIVVIRSVGVVLVGLALGLPLSYLFTKSFAHLLYGVQPIEPIVVAVIVGAVLTTALAAAYLPARLAGRVDPVVALKGE